LYAATPHQLQALHKLRLQIGDEVQGEVINELQGILSRVHAESAPQISQLQSKKIGVSHLFFQNDSPNPLFEKRYIGPRRIAVETFRGRTENRVLDPYTLYTVYDKRGAVSTVIKTRSTSIGTRKVEYIESIKSFYAPTARRLSSPLQRHEIAKEKKRTSQERAIARKHKFAGDSLTAEFFNLALSEKLIDPFDLPNFVTRDADNDVQFRRERRVQMSMPGKAFTPRRCGKIQQEREYKLPFIPDQDDYFKLRELTANEGRRRKGDFCLERRLNKSRINARDNSYSVLLRTSAEVYTVTRYNSIGHQLEQLTFNKRNEAVRANRDFKPNHSIRRPRRGKPTDAQARQKATKRLGRYDMIEELEEIEGFHTICFVFRKG